MEGFYYWGVSLSLAAVSYTHLDVYKRQCQNWTPAGKALSDHAGEPPPGGRGTAGVTDPVSYTHLDVYKRQQQRDYARTHQKIVEIPVEKPVLYKKCEACDLSLIHI